MGGAVLLQNPVVEVEKVLAAIQFPGIWNPVEVLSLDSGEELW